MKEYVAKQLARTPFVPHPALRNAHAQTIVGSIVPRRFKLVTENCEPRQFMVAPGVRVLAHCSWQGAREDRPTLLVSHGLEGSIHSNYMLGTAEKAVAAGFNVIRLNHRNCGGTEHLSSTLYHAGLTEDLRQIVRELYERDRLSEIYIVGFSLGGNMVLKLMGEYGNEVPAAVKGAVAVSPSIHLASCADAIEMRSNLLYHMSFVLSLRSSLKRKARLFPDRYDVSGLGRIWTIREFDNVYTAPHSGFRDVTEYYDRASALPFISRIQVPTLIIHAKDDPFIPFAPFEGREVSSNPHVHLLAPERGGHVGFISATGEGDGRFWAESRIVEYAKLLSKRGSNRSPG
jgi:uncharacterized protein